MEPVTTSQIHHHVTHPTAQWLTTDNGTAKATLTARVDPELPPTSGEHWPRSEDDRTPLRHPHPNCFTLDVHEGNEGCTEARLTMTRQQLTALHTAINEALGWDGQ